MKLIEALEIVRKETPAEARAFRVSLVCGFTPAHLQTFLHANLKQVLPDRNVAISAGLYGDFWGTLQNAHVQNPDAIVVAMEWSDLDPRLGLRSLGSWAPDVFDDILRGVRARVLQFKEISQGKTLHIPIAISGPTLPLPPVSFAAGWSASEFELSLRVELSSLLLHANRSKNIRIMNAQRLDQLSPLANRLDVKSELASGFPYKIPHASVVAELLSLLTQPPSPKKGLITDLDDTVWSGILGEVGAPGLTWALENNSHMHGVYQKLLNALAETGALIAAASKNDIKLVQEALRREDLILRSENVFPVEAHWGPKSESLARILKTWNIGTNAVVFIDDSPMELAEVKAAYPEVECILFPKDDPQAIEGLLHRLRDLFGKNALSEEDALRGESIRRAHETDAATIAHGSVSEEFLKQADAEISLDFSKQPLDPRALELVNKTNQFNLNGRRYTEKEWQDFVGNSSSILSVVSYRDKYGPLGKIAVLSGHLNNHSLRVDTWVMSCRAFSRRIEYKCLEELFLRFHLEDIILDFTATAKNGPTCEFLETLLGTEPLPQCRISRKVFFERRLESFHRVREPKNG